jgi:hypothetical protein
MELRRTPSRRSSQKALSTHLLNRYSKPFVEYLEPLPRTAYVRPSESDLDNYFEAPKYTSSEPPYKEVVCRRK